MNDRFRAAIAVTGLGMLLVAPPVAAAQPGVGGQSSMGASATAVARSAHQGSDDWQGLLSEMQAEGLLAVRTVDWKPSAPAQVAPAQVLSDCGNGIAADSQRPSPPEGVRASTCPSP